MSEVDLSTAGIRTDATASRSLEMRIAVRSGEIIESARDGNSRKELLPQLGSVGDSEKRA